MAIRFTHIVLLALLLTLGACAAAKKPEIPAGVVLINEKELSELVEVSPVSNSRTETGILNVWTSIRNTSRNKLLVEVRAVFTGEGGSVIENSSGWTRLFIEPGASATFQTSSMSSTVKSVAIEIKEGNR